MCEPKGTQRMSERTVLAQYLQDQRLATKPPRHSSTKHTTEEGTINSKVKHWDYTTWKLVQDLKKRKEREPLNQNLSETFKGKKQNP